MLKQSIAIFGATGHIGKNLSAYFCKEENFEVFLFTRDEKKLEKILAELKLKNNSSIKTYNEFNDSKYDTIINCVGNVSNLWKTSDPTNIIKAEEESIKINETIDTIALEYLKKFPKTKLINFSSGSIYGGKFTTPIKDTILIDEKNQKKIDIKSPYTIAKINSEVKHRKLKNFNIIDLRLFSFFSKFMDLKSKFFLSDAVYAIKQKKKFLIDGTDFYRDYIHPKDLFSYVKKCIYKDNLNDVFDLCSKKPIGKFELLNFLKVEYGLEYEINSNVKFPNPTGFKINYYSESKKAEILGHKSEYSSRETISDQLSFLIE